jgi:HEPN domain-containing protein
MAEAELVKKWVEKAKEDFGYASSSIEEGMEYYPQICWHFQQAAEKYLKAYIVAHDLEFRKVHDLAALLKICERKLEAFSSLLDSCKYLQKFYVEARYPVAWEIKYSRDDAIKAKEAAQNIIEFVDKQLSS